jgi:WD40 repeat protein
LAFGPDGTTLASVGQEGTVTVWDADAGRMRQTALLRPPPRRPLAVDGSRLQLASAQDGIVVEDPFGKGPRRELHGGFLCRLARSWRRLAPGARPAADALAFRPDGGLLATACGSGIALWDVGEGALIGTLRGHEGSVSDLAFSADGKSLVSGSQEDGTIRVWDVRSFAR